MTRPITSLTQLPADRRAVALHTADGVVLVGELALPVDRAPVATLVCLHPLPTEGGSMDSHVIAKLAWRLPALAGVAVLRINTRGTASQLGESGGSFDDGDSERYDVAAALDLVEHEDLPSSWLLGWSFGSELVLRYGWCDDTVAGGVLLSPPLRRAGDADLRGWASSGKPLLVLVPEHDQFLTPAAARPRFAAVPQAELVGVDGAKHLWVGERYVRRVLDEIVRRVAPGAPTPLPTEWPPTHTDEETT